MQTHVDRHHHVLLPPARNKDCQRCPATPRLPHANNLPSDGIEVTPADSEIDPCPGPDERWNQCAPDRVETVQNLGGTLSLGVRRTGRIRGVGGPDAVAGRGGVVRRSWRHSGARSAFRRQYHGRLLSSDARIDASGGQGGPWQPAAPSRSGTYGGALSGPPTLPAVVKT